ncbi:VOC family protein [Pedobacter lusitanus]|uniref:hypothetical protein n=1 Tax=Pedobacter lusitanus TaxID=1503925 RepID=UPI001F33A10D|nr:hypothetical protein [Pedobacter lusitanus]
MLNAINRPAGLVPELSVTDIKASLSFWCDLIGFSILYDRPEQGFAYLGLNGTQIMLEQRDITDRTWETGSFELPPGITKIKANEGKSYRYSCAESGKSVEILYREIRFCKKKRMCRSAKITGG